MLSAEATTKSCGRPMDKRPKGEGIPSWPLFPENLPKMHTKWEKLLSSVPLVNFVDHKVAITSPELSDLPCNVLMHLTSGLLNIQQAKA